MFRGAGGVAQLGERLNGIQEVRGSIPLTSIPEPVEWICGVAGDVHIPIRFIESVCGLPGISRE